MSLDFVNALIAVCFVQTLIIMVLITRFGMEVK